MSNYGPTPTPITIILSAWDRTKEGEIPSQIAYYDEPPGSGEGRIEFYDECILLFRKNLDFSQPGVEQYYEKDTIEYDLIVSTISTMDRFNQIVKGLRRIALSFQGNNEFTRLHVDSISPQQSVFYHWGIGTLTASMHLGKRR